MLSYIRLMIKEGKHLVIGFIVLSIFVWYCASFYSSDVFRIYSGVKFKDRDISTGEPVNILIAGKYLSTFMNKENSFRGTIQIGQEIYYFTENPLMFNEQGMAVMGTYSITHNDKECIPFIYGGNKLKSLAIEIHEETGAGTYSADWFITAPCSNREEAVRITNKLIRKQYIKKQIR